MQISKKTFATLTFMLLFLSVGFAQNADRAQKVRQMIWKKKGAQYTNTTIPEKWKNESAVILFQDYSHVYDGRGKRIEAENTYHIRIALLDKAAVKEYSEFSFSEKFNGRTSRSGFYRGVTYTGFRVIKKDGSEEIINLDEAVQIESEDGDDTKKIAIPNLQVGDIIDYYYFEEQKLALTEYLHVFTPVVSTLATSYPIAYLKKQFTVEKNFHISYKAVNGAPEMEEEVQDKLRIFKIEAEDIDKVEDTEWMYANRSLPTIKFQVFYSKHGKAALLPNFIGEAGSIKSEVTEADISKFIGKILAQSYPFNQKGFESQLKNRGISIYDLDDKALAQEIYFYIYHSKIGRSLESYYLGNINYQGINDYYWIGQMESAFNKNNIPSKVLVIPNRVYSDQNDLLFLEELNYMIKVEGKGAEEDLYLTNFYLHPVANQIPTDAQGVKAFEAVLSSGQGGISLYSVNRQPTVNTRTIPQEAITKNNVNVLSDVSINEDMTGLVFDNTYMLTGMSRDYYQYRLLNLYDYIDEEYKLYDTENLVERTVKKKKKPIVAQNIKELKERHVKDRKERLEGILASDYKVDEVEIESFEITSKGRRNNPLFAYDTKFSLEGLIKQAGPNYLLNVGLLVTGQREIEEKDRKERKVDIYASNPRSFDSAITLTIPEGYTVQGVDELNVDVQNETGGFVTTAVLNGNQLNLTYKKWYSNTFEPKENWNKLLEFLDAALAFNEAQVLLKKG